MFQARFRSHVTVLFFVVTTLLASGAQAAADPVAIDLPAGAQVVNLGSSIGIPVTITASSTFDGTVVLGFDLTELNQASPQGKVALTITPNEIQLAPGQSAQATIEVKTDSMAPTVSAVKVGVQAQVINHGSVQIISSPFSLSVDSIFEIRLFGGPAPESWDSPKSASFAPHAEGVLVRFINMDTQDAHVIHSTGPIPHGDTANPLQPAVAPGEQGDTYEFRVTGAQKMKDIYYCHVHESSGQARTLLFNQ